MEPAIKMAEQKLDFLSSDPQTIELYKAREYSAHERANILNTGIERGRLQGQLEAKLEVAKALLDILDDKMISEKTGLNLEEIRKLREY